MIGIYWSAEVVDSGIAYSYDELYGKTFEPVYQTLILDRVNGKTYAEKKECVRDKAITWSHLHGLIVMDWFDCATIGEWFYRYGKRYGLLNEFRENGIC